MSRPRPAAAPRRLEVLAVEGIGEVHRGADLAAVVAGAVLLVEGDVLLVTSKVVSKAEGQVRTGSRETTLGEETDRTVARRGATSIVRTRHGLVLAAAGIDASNTEPGTVLLLPVDPDASARRLREALFATTGRNVAVVVTDTAGRAWRTGQTDIAIGAAGLAPLHDLSGQRDPHGNLLAVTAPAVADELAAAGDLVKGKLERRPAAVVRGLADLVLPVGEHGPGAASLVREEPEDLFGLGAREAVLAALAGTQRRGFGRPCPRAELVEALRDLVGPGTEVEPPGRDGAGGPAAPVTVRLDVEERRRGADDARLRAAAFALGWRVVPGPDRRPDDWPDGPPGDTPADRRWLWFVQAPL